MFDDGSGQPAQACYELDEGDHHDHMVDIETVDVIELLDQEIENQ